MHYGIYYHSILIDSCIQYTLAQPLHLLSMHIGIEMLAAYQTLCSTNVTLYTPKSTNKNIPQLTFAHQGQLMLIFKEIPLASHPDFVY